MGNLLAASKRDTESRGSVIGKALESSGFELALIPIVFALK